MGINIKNIAGLIGLVVLLFNARTLLREANDMNPCHWLESVQASGEPERLVILGMTLVGILLLLRHLIRHK